MLVSAHRLYLSNIFGDPVFSAELLRVMKRHVIRVALKPPEGCHSCRMGEE